MITENPTFQSSGQMRVLVENNLPKPTLINEAKIEYWPVDEPPRTWTKGKEYGSTKMVLIQAKDGHNCPMIIADRSKAAVEDGKKYIVTLGTEYPLQLIFVLQGEQGGSTCTPGVGLYNMTEKKWYNCFPKNFSGRWGISLKTPVSSMPIYVSIEYVSSHDYNFSLSEVANFSRLFYSISGWRIAAGLKDINVLLPNDLTTELMNEPIELLQADGEYEIVTF